MDQVSATGSGVVVPAAAQTPVAAEPSGRELNRAVSAAVKILNNAGRAGEGREVTFSVDRATRLPVVKVVDIDTKEVLQQWPSDYVLQLAEAYQKSEQDSR